MKNTNEYLELLVLTGLSDSEIDKILKKSTISIEELKNFYAMSGRLPTIAEEAFINTVGFNFVHQMHMKHKTHDIDKIMGLLSKEMSKKKSFSQKIKYWFKSWA